MRVKVTIPADSYELIVKADRHEQLLDEEINSQVLRSVRENVGFTWKKVERD